MEPFEIIEGQVAVLDRADVDTDQIIPKQFLKRIERTGFGEFLFYDWFRSGEIELEPHPILVAGRNFGSGSSREHAVWALKDYGFDAVIAPSFSDIFYSNCTKNGLLPVILDEEQCRTVAGSGEARIDLDDQTVNCAEGVFQFEIDEQIKHRLINGLDDVAMTLRARGDDRRVRGRRQGGPRPGDDRAVSGAGPAMNTGAARVGRRDLRPRLRPQFSWGMEVLERLELAGDETVLDAGAGSGRVTAELVKRLPEGRVIALDGSEQMIAKARENLGDARRRIRRHGPRRARAARAGGRRLLHRDLPLGHRPRQPLPAHPRRAATRRAAARAVRRRGQRRRATPRRSWRSRHAEPFAQHYEGMPMMWNFAEPEETEAAPARSRLRGGRCWLEHKPLTPDRPA